MSLSQNSVPSQPLLRFGPLIGLIGLLAGLYFDASHQISKGDIGAFKTFYPAATALSQGNDPYVATRGIFAYIYPPFYAYLLQPLASLPRPTAARVMLGVNAACILAALLLSAAAILRRLGAKVDLAGVGIVSLVTALVAVVPIRNELRGLETNCILLLSFVLALYWVDRWPILAGLALAMAISIKYLPIIALPYLLVRRRYAAVVGTLVSIIALALVPAITLGFSTNLKYLQFALGGLLHLAGVQTADTVAQVHSTDVETSISITSALARRASDQHLSKAAGTIMTALAAGIWGVSILLPYLLKRIPLLRWPDATKQRSGPFDALLAIEWTAIVTFAIAFSPNTQNRNLVMAIVPVALAVALISMQSSLLPRILMALVIAVMFTALLLPVAAMGKPFTVAWVSGGWACWLLLGASIMSSWIALVHASRRQ